MVTYHSGCFDKAQGRKVYIPAKEKKCNIIIHIEEINYI